MSTKYPKIFKIKKFDAQKYIQFSMCMFYSSIDTYIFDIIYYYYLREMLKILITYQ